MTSEVVELRLAPDFADYTVSVFDQRDRLVYSGWGTATVELPPDVYVVRTQLLGHMRERVFRLEAARELPLVSPPLYSPVPFAGTAGVTERQRKAAVDLSSRTTTSLIGVGAPEARVAVFLRAASGDSVALTDGFYLRDSDGDELVDLGDNDVWVHGPGISIFAAAVEPGTYRLRLASDRVPGGQSRDVIVAAHEGWTTSVFLFDVGRPLIEIPSMLLAPIGDRFDPQSRAGRTLEILARSLSESSAPIPPDIENDLLALAGEQPLLGIVVGNSLAAQGTETAGLEALIAILDQAIPGSADVATLRAAVEKDGAAQLFRVEDPPVSRVAHHSLMTIAASNPGALAPGGLAERIGGAVLTDSPWTSFDPAQVEGASPPEWLATSVRDLAMTGAYGAVLAGSGPVDEAGLAEALGVSRAGVAAAIEELDGPLGDPPYPGMRAFDESNGKNFFGRPTEIKEVRARLLDNRMVVIVAPSGSGKSSLMRAGVARALLDDGGWTRLELRPGTQPVTAVREMARQVAAAAAGQVLLLVDPLEDIFKVPVRDAEEFWQELMQLLTQPAVHILAAVRADFYADLMREPWWTDIADRRYELLPMKRAALTAAVEGPAEASGVAIDPKLVATIVADCGNEPGILPFVQVTMRLLWESVRRRYLPFSAYEALEVPDTLLTVPGRIEQAGGEDDQEITGLRAAIAIHGEKVWNSEALAAIDSGHEITQRVFLRLVAFVPGRDQTRQRQTQAELIGDQEDETRTIEVLEFLASEEIRLLTTGRGRAAPDRTVDVAHEALLYGWPRLRIWAEQLQEAELYRRRLLAVHREWKELAEDDPEAALLDATRLDIAESWVTTDEASIVGVDSEILELIDASRARLDSIADKERQQLEREQRQQQRNRRLLVLLVVVMAVAAGISGLLWRNAESEANRATSLFLAERSIDIPTESLDKALLVALEAKLFDDNIETRGAVKSVLERIPQLLGWFRAHPNNVLAVAASRDGFWMASGGRGPPVAGSELPGASLLLWNRRFGESPTALEGHTEEIMAVDFSPDGRLLASASRDGSVIVWETATGRPLATLRLQSGSLPLCETDSPYQDDVQTVEFSPDGSVLAAAGHAMTVQLWDVVALDPIGVLEGHVCNVQDIAFSPDGAHLASVSRDDTLRLWDVSTGVGAVLAGEPNGDRDDVAHDLRAVAIDPVAPEQIATGGNDGTIRIWTTEGEQLHELAVGGHTARIFDLTYVPHRGGSAVVSVGRDQALIRWNPPTGEILGPLVAHSASVRAVEYDASRGRILTASEDRTVGEWRLSRRVRLGAGLLGLADDAVTIAVSPDGAYVAAGGDDATLMVWDAASLGHAHAPLSGHDDDIRDLVFVDESIVAAGDAAGAIHLWDVARGIAASPPLRNAHAGDLRSLAHWPEENTLFSAGFEDGVVAIWEVSDPAALDRRDDFTVPDCAILDIAVVRQRGQLLVSCNEGPLWIWQRGAGAWSGEMLFGEGQRIRSLSVRHDGALVAGGSTTGTVWLWEISDGSQPEIVDVTQIDVADEEVLAVEFVGNGDRLLFGTADGNIHLWEVDPPAAIGEPLQGLGPVRSLAAHPTSDAAFVVSDGGARLRLVLDEEEWVDVACELADPSPTREEWNLYLGGVRPLRSTCDVLGR